MHSKYHRTGYQERSVGASHYKYSSWTEFHDFVDICQLPSWHPPPNKFGGILRGCMLSRALRFSDTMPTEMVGHSHRPCHSATTPLDGRYLVCFLEDVQCSVDVCLYFPAAGTSVHATMLPVRREHFPTTMAGSWSVFLIHIVIHFNSCELTFVL
jgi:hypothetical protein